MVRVLWVVVMLAVLFNMTEAWAQEEHPVQARLVADSGMAPPGSLLLVNCPGTADATRLLSYTKPDAICCNFDVTAAAFAANTSAVGKRTTKSFFIFS